jgi:hypothetical protein
MNDPIEDLQLRTGPDGLDQHINYDRITYAFVESIDPLRQLADLAYGYAHIDGVSLCQRRSLERVGMRATDLLTELANFVRIQS